MPKLIMMKGLPFSGKTQWATEWANAKPNRLRLSWSDLLKMMGGREQREKRVIAYDGMLRMMCCALRAGNDVVIDECNLNGLEWGVIIARAQLCHAKVEWQTMKTTAEECKEKARAVDSPISDMEIDRLAKRFDVWLKQK